VNAVAAQRQRATRLIIRLQALLEALRDRIRDLVGHNQRLAPGLQHERRLITFRYRLAAPLAQGELRQRFEQQHGGARQRRGGDRRSPVVGRAVGTVTVGSGRSQGIAQLHGAVAVGERRAGHPRPFRQAYGRPGRKTRLPLAGWRQAEVCQQYHAPSALYRLVERLPLLGGICYYRAY